MDVISQEPTIFMSAIDKKKLSKNHLRSFNASNKCIQNHAKRQQES